KATTVDEGRVAVVVLEVLTVFKSLRFWVANTSAKSKCYVTNHPPFQEELSPSTGRIIPLSRKKYPRFQEELSPFPGENGKQHPLLQETATRYEFLRCYTIISLPVSRQSSPFPGGIIPISRRIGNPCSGWLITPSSFTGKSIIPVS